MNTVITTHCMPPTALVLWLSTVVTAGSDSVQPVKNIEHGVTLSPFTYLGEPGSGGRIDAISVNPFDNNRVLTGGDMFGTGYSNDAGESWRDNGGGGKLTNYEISDFTWDPKNIDDGNPDNDRVWGATYGGPALSTDGGRTFYTQSIGIPDLGEKGVRHRMGIEKVLYDPNAESLNRLIAFGGDRRGEKNSNKVGSWGRIWHSDNDGQTWKLSPESRFKNQNIVDAEYAQNGNTLFIAIKGHGVFRNDADGKAGQWIECNHGLEGAEDLTSLTLDPTSPDGDRLWVSSESKGVYYSGDGGMNWERRSRNLPEPTSSKRVRFRAVEYATHEGDQPVLYVGQSSDAGNKDGVYRSTDGGKTWAGILTDNRDVRGRFCTSSRNVWWIEIDPSDPDVIYAGGTDDLIKSEDGGKTWRSTLSQTNGNLHSGTGFSGWVMSNITLHPTDPDLIMTQAWDTGRLMRTTDGGKTWDRRDTNEVPDFRANFLGGFGLAYDPNDSDKMFGIFGSQNARGHTLDFSRSSNKGLDWVRLSHEGLPMEKGSRYWYDRIVISKETPDQVWLAAGQRGKGGLFFSSNADGDPDRVRWRTIDVDGQRVRDIAADPHTPNGLYVATDGGLYYSSNGESDFKRIGGSDAPKVSNDVHALTLHLPEGYGASNQVVYWAAAINDNRNHGLWRYDPSQSSGHRWDRLKPERWIRQVDTDPNRPNHIAFTTNKDAYQDSLGATGVWFSADGGRTWTNQKEGLAMLRTSAIVFSNDGKKLYVGTMGRGTHVAEVLIE